MTIKITDDKIQFDNFSLALSARGLSVTDKNNPSVLAELKAKSVISSTYSFQGSQFGYISGGYATTSTTPDYTQRIQKFPFAVAGGLLNHVANLTHAEGHGLTGVKSAINGYTCGGFHHRSNSVSVTLQKGFPVPGFGWAPGTQTQASTRNKINFASDYNTLEGGIFLSEGGTGPWWIYPVNSFFNGFDYAAGNSSSTDGYISAGRATNENNDGIVSSSQIHKFSFSSDSNGYTVAGLTGFASLTSPAQSTMATGCSSSTHGHVVSEFNITKFPYANESVGQTFFPNAIPSAHGLLAAGLSSATHGYIAGGTPGVPDTFGGPATGLFVNSGTSIRSPSSPLAGTPINLTTSPYGPGNSSTAISKFSFTTLGFASQIANLNYKRGSATGISSISHGIVYGGRVNPAFGSGSTFIERFPFASDVNAIEVGDIGTDRSGSAGFQY